MGTMAGCILRAPKETTGLSSAAILHRAAPVAMPEAWQSSPSRAVSCSANAPYGPVRVRTGSWGRQIVPSGTALTSTGTFSKRYATSSSPATTNQASGSEVL